MQICSPLPTQQLDGVRGLVVWNARVALQVIQRTEKSWGLQVLDPSLIWCS